MNDSIARSVRLELLERRVKVYEAALNEIRQIDAKDCPFDIYQIADDAILKERYRDWAKWDGEYRKTAYLVRTKNGETYGCWPNAGKMVCIHKHGDMEFTPDDDVEVMETTIEYIQEHL
jgi:hypothetical protein